MQRAITFQRRVGHRLSTIIAQKATAAVCHRGRVGSFHHVTVKSGGRKETYVDRRRPGMKRYERIYHSSSTYQEAYCATVWLIISYNTKTNRGHAYEGGESETERESRSMSLEGRAEPMTESSQLWSGPKDPFHAVVVVVTLHQLSHSKKALRLLAGVSIVELARCVRGDLGVPAPSRNCSGFLILKVYILVAIQPRERVLKHSLDI